ncbi:MAG: hypothetical protein PHI05_05295, partial [Bacilli bacterium]|nr:hypothetical protein [Bacilli bacterium]
DEENFRVVFDQILSLIEGQDITKNDIKYLSNYGIGTFLLGDNLDEVLIKNYPNMFTIEKNNDGRIAKLNEKIFISNNGNRIGLKEYIESLDIRYKKIFYVFDDLDLNILQISPVAELIGLVYYSISINHYIDFKNWF